MRTFTFRTWALVLLVCTLSACSNNNNDNENQMDKNMKKNIGSVLALYPTPTVVIGTMIDGKVNWMLAGHVGIMCHDHIMVSLFQKHYTNKGIKENLKFSVNVVDEAMLPKADYVGIVSGAKTDKSKVFDYFVGDGGTPVIKDAPVTMECKVEDNYVLNNFDNFICSIIDTYANEAVLNEAGKINYDELKPVLFEMPTYTYLRTGERIGKCKTIGKKPTE